MKKGATLLLIFILLFTVGCSGNAENTNTNSNDKAGSVAEEKQEAYAFMHNGTTVALGAAADPVVALLGEPLSYFEAPSCAFEGLDKIYYYNGFELYTYPVDGVDHISAVVFSDDSVSTVEGAYLGMTMEKALQAYGDAYTQEQGATVYTKGKTSLTLLEEDGFVAAISYNYANLE